MLFKLFPYLVWPAIFLGAMWYGEHLGHLQNNDKVIKIIQKQLIAQPAEIKYVHDKQIEIKTVVQTLKQKVPQYVSDKTQHDPNCSFGPDVIKLLNDASNSLNSVPASK